MEFEWDQSKEQENIQKHGFSFADAVECFKDRSGIRLIDESHSGSEDRFYWIGKHSTGAILTVRFAQRGSKIRIIGCGNWRKYRRHYYEALKKQKA